MEIRYLTVPKEEEERVIAHGAWFNRDNGMYAITKYQDPKDFAGLENGMKGTLDALSLTMACRFMGLDRKLVWDFLIREGYLDQQKMPTEKGLKAGLEVRTRANRVGEGSYAVYPDEFLDSVLWPKREALRSADMPVSHTRRLRDTLYYLPAAPDVCTKHRKLRIPDDLLCPGAVFSGYGKDDTIISLTITDTERNLLFEQKDGSFSPASFQQLLSLLQGRTLVGHNLPLLYRMLLQTAQKAGFPDGSLRPCLRGGIDTVDIFRTFLASSSYKLKDLAGMMGIACPDPLTAQGQCKLLMDMLDALEERTFLPIVSSISPAVPTYDSESGREVLSALRSGLGTDGAAAQTGIPQDLTEKIFLLAEKDRQADPQWVMTLEREQELFTFIKQNPDWNGHAASLKKLAGTRFTAFEVDTSLSDWRFVKSLERIRPK